MFGKTPIILLSTLAAASLFAADAVKSHVAEIFSWSDADVKVVAKIKGTGAGHANWRSDAPKTITATKKVSDSEWGKMGFTVVPDSDATLNILLRSNFARDKNGAVLSNRTLFRNLAFDGKPEAELAGQSGHEATYARGIPAKISVKKGVPVSVSVEAKVPAKWDGTYTVDISECANIPADGSKGGISAYKNLPEGVVELGGMKYDFPKSGVNRAAAVSVSTPLKADLSGKGIRGKYVYVLGAVSNDLKYTDHACASMLVSFENGGSEHFWIRKDRDFGDSAGTTKFNSKCIPVFGGGKDGGVLYFTKFVFKENAGAIKSISIDGEKLNVFAITVSSENLDTIVPKQYDLSQWKPVDISDLAVKEGTALDLSKQVESAPAGSFGKMRVSENGRFEFENRAGVPVKFQGTNWRPGDGFGTTIKTHADIDELAKMMRRQGYNLVRWRISMRGNGEFSAPYTLREYNKDMYDYFFYAMAREGVYSHFNLSSHDLGNPDFKWADRFDVKILMFFGDEKTRADWRKFVKWELNLVNKYTGKKWKDDPSIVSTEYFNEIELGPVGLRNASPRVKKFVNAKFVEFLKNKYKTFENWDEPEWKARRNLKSFDDVKISDEGISQRDIALFIIENGRDLQRFCEGVVRGEEGFNVPLHQHNCVRATSFALLSAEAGDYTALNVYHKHPSAFMSEGSVVGSESSVSEFGEYFRAAAAKRVAGRPMMLSEWQHCHWNPYKHEGGVLFPSYSALQGFDNLTVHDVAVLKSRGALGPFEVAGSPVFRANEFLTSVLFFRGDVKTSDRRVDIVYDDKYLENSREVGNAMNTEQSKLALLTGFGIEFPTARKTPAAAKIKTKPADLQFEPIGSSASWAASNVAGTGAGDKKFDISQAAKRLREAGILPADNATDPAKGVFQSDTGEITMRVKEELVKVATANTEAVALKPATKNEKVGALTVKSVSVPAAVAASSVDGNPLAESGRIVFIFNTNNISTNFKVSRDETTFISKGTTPILMQVGKVSATLEKPSLGFFDDVASLFGAGKKFSLYALKITGERLEKIPLEESDGMLKIEIDTSKLKEFSPFFEIVAE